jgi:hypothetical protein
VCRDEVDGRVAARTGGGEIGAIRAPRERTVILHDVRLEDVVDEVRRLRRQEPQQNPGGERTLRAAEDVTSP